MEGPNKKKLVIAGPHGDERNAQRVIMVAQRHFIKNGGTADTVLYFIPCLSPTMAFADARGIPVVDEIGNKLSIDEAVSRISIPYLHNLIAKQVPIDPRDPNKTGLLRTLIQDSNGTAFKTFEDYKAGKVDPEYPRYGIDANRDIRGSLVSTRNFGLFIDSLRRNTSVENIKVIMMHGYYQGGGVFGTYSVKSGEEAVMDNNDAKYFANALWDYLYPPPIADFFSGTDTEPLKYAGEWNQTLYRDHGGILSVDIELPRNFDEGRRNETVNGQKKYNPQDVLEQFDGILARNKGSYYGLLDGCSELIDKYIEKTD
jgi:hypothetical protein